MRASRPPRIPVWHGRFLRPAGAFGAVEVEPAAIGGSLPGACQISWIGRKDENLPSTLPDSSDIEAAAATVFCPSETSSDSLRYIGLNTIFQACRLHQVC